MRLVVLRAVTTAGAPPKLALAPASNPAPERTTAVPPRVLPLTGATEARVGASGGGATKV